MDELSKMDDGGLLLMLNQIVCNFLFLRLICFSIYSFLNGFVDFFVCFFCSHFCFLMIISTKRILELVTCYCSFIRLLCALKKENVFHLRFLVSSTFVIRLPQTS